MDSSLIGSAVIEVSADLKPFEDALDALPSDMRAKVVAAQQAIRAQMSAVSAQHVAAVDAGDAAKAAQLAAEYGQLRAQLDALNGALARYGEMMRESAQAQDAASLGVVRLNAGVAAMGNGVQEAGRKSAGASMLLLQLGQFADDAQYGMRGIANNIPMLASSFGQMLGATTGQTMALAGAWGIFATVLNQVIQHWEDYSRIAGLGTTKTEAQLMEELAKATANASTEQARLNKLKQEQKETQALYQAQSKGTEEEAGRLKAAIAESGASNVVMAAVGGRTRDRLVEDDEFKAEMRRAEDLMRRASKGDTAAAEQLAKDVRASGANDAEFMARSLEGTIPTDAEMEADDKRAQAKRKKREQEARQDAEKEDRFVEQDDEANRKEFEARREAQRRRAEKIAKDLEKSPEFLQGKTDRADIEAALKAHGFDDPERMGRRADLVREALDKDYKEAVGKRSSERGVGREEAAAELSGEAASKLALQQSQARLQVLQLQQQIGQINRPEILGTDQFLKGIQMAALEGGSDIAKQQLDVLNKQLDAAEKAADALDRLANEGVIAKLD